MFELWEIKMQYLLLVTAPRNTKKQYTYNPTKDDYMTCAASMWKSDYLMPTQNHGKLFCTAIS